MSVYGKTCVVWLGLLLSVQVAWGQPMTTEEIISGVLDDFHDAAARADYDRYFGHFTANAIFLGTDATERWTLDEFQTYARPSFEAGRGWTYTKTARHVYVSADGSTAWFDEMLSNASYGECRGSGVLIKVGASWKLAQYHLTIPIPNALARTVVDMIREEQK